MRVLAIDGGGIRGLIPALVLAELEEPVRRPVFELFDLMAGTSTGGILVSALCAPDLLPAAEVAEIYEEEGPRIFDRSIRQRIQSADGLLDEKYDAAALDRALERFIGDKRLSATRPDLIVPTYDTAAPGPHFFKTTNAREDPATDARLADVARATSSAPTYFEPLELGPRALLDGGVFAVNPAMSALAEVLRDSPGPRSRWSRSAPASEPRSAASTRSRTGGWWSGRARSSTWCSTGPRMPLTIRCGTCSGRSATGASRPSPRRRATTSTTRARRT